jgi:hypothetical protein
VKRTLEVLLSLLLVDLTFVIVGGGASLVDLRGDSRVEGLGFFPRCAAIALLLLWRYGALATDRADRGRLLLALLLLPALAQFHFAGGRIGGDGVSYFVYTRSLVKDGDLDFTNEYTHYGWIDRGDIKVPTRTGLRRSIFAVGPGLVSIPFFLLGEAVGRMQALAGATIDLSGYGDVHVHAVGLGGFLYGFAAVLAIHALLRRHFLESVALLATLLLWFATFLHWYMTQQPTMSHVSSTCGAALILLVWDKSRRARSARGYALFGLLLGFAMCLRWQNGVFLVLPGLELLRRVGREGLPWPRAARFGGLLALGALVGVSPQMAAWKVLYGVFVLPTPPHGADFLRLDHPWILNTLFSSRHGLLSWTPVLWAGFLGFLPLLKRKPAVAVPLLLPLLLMTYVNMCSGDWWAGGSFSNRRFDSLLPVLAFGTAALIESLRRFVGRKPEWALAGLALPVILWNGLLVQQVRLGLIPGHDAVEGPRLVGNAARLVSATVGFPTTWPASWTFAAQTGLSPAQYDRLVGRYLFYRQNNRQGRIRIGADDDVPMLGEGWGPVGRADGVLYRSTREPARVLAPLDVAEDLDVLVHAASEAEPVRVTVRVNGRDAGRFLAEREWDEHGLRVPSGLWRRELNDVVLAPDGGALRVAKISFVRLKEKR